VSARRGRGAALLVLGLLLAGSASCRRRHDGGAVVATLLEAQGTVEGEVAPAGSSWRPVAPGVGFAVGDALRTGPRSGARLRLSGGGVIRLDENARLRFRSGTASRKDAADLGVELGTAEIDEEVAEVSVVTVAGAARVAPGGRLRVRADQRTASFEVLVGRATVVDGPREIPVDAGQGVKIRFGDAVVERFSVKVGGAVVERASEPAAPVADAGVAAAPEPAVPPPAPPPPSSVPAPEPAAAAAAAARADITIPAGESAIVHDARPPVAVRLRFERLCPSGGVVEIRRGARRPLRLTGTGAVVLRVGAGPYRYRVRCADDPHGAAPRASGLLTLRRDTGNVPLARRAPANVIDADGRRYTVLYQSRLPLLTLAWPAGRAAAGPFELHLESAAGGDRVVPSPDARHQMAAGTLAEGTYSWWYVSHDGKRSPKTTVTIRFDNTAPTAQFFHATAAGVPPGPGIAVDGVTLQGAKVSAAGKALALDEHGRFRARLVPQEGDDAVAVRLEHPRSGVHYYVRRRGGAH
jgi:hypothetical protein